MYNLSLSNFYRFGKASPSQNCFKVYEIKNQVQVLDMCNQRGFYKVCLISGNNIIRYGHNEIKTSGTNLFFGNAHTTYRWEFNCEEQKGYTCILTEDFLKRFDYLNVLQQARLFESDSTPMFTINDEVKNFITAIFNKMILEQNTDYFFKEELMHNCLSLIMHEAIKIKNSRHSFLHPMFLS